MQTSEEPVLLDVARAEGVFLYDQNGRAIIDMISGIGVSNLGHHQKSVVEAIQNQAENYLHTMVYGEFVQTPQVQLAQKLIEATHNHFGSVFFVNSGSEAVEGALKLAKRHTRRSNIVAMKNAYHGSTHGALSLMSDPYFSNFYRPLVPGVSFMDFNDMSPMEIIDENCAAVVVEPIQGEAGYIPARQEFIKALRQRCDETGAVLIFDEIQSGMGRTGKLFAYEHYDTIPDILCSAKALGAGMPLGAFFAKPEMDQAFTKNPVLGHISTFGGHPVSCAAALSGMEILMSQDIIEAVNDKEELLRSLLVHPEIKGISGKGLMLSIELKDEPYLKSVVRRCLDQGLMIDWFLYADDRLRISPPLVITKEEIKKAVDIILRALSHYSS